MHRLLLYNVNVRLLDLNKLVETHHSFWVKMGQ